MGSLLSLPKKATKQTLLPGTGSTHILQDSVGAHSSVFIWGFPFPDIQKPGSAAVVWGRKQGNSETSGTVKTANEQRGGVVMDTAVDWEWGRVGMLQHQSICWQWHLGLYKLIE